MYGGIESGKRRSGRRGEREHDKKEKKKFFDPTHVTAKLLTNHRTWYLQCSRLFFDAGIGSGQKL